MSDRPRDDASAREPIAIVGIGCRLPGDVDGPEALWDLLLRRVDAIGEIPPSRFDVRRWYDERPQTPGRIAQRQGGYLDGVEDFDAGFFGVAPVEAERLDPQQRLLLEVAWEALEEGGIVLDAATRKHAGVYVGVWIQDFEARLFADPEQVDYYMTTGSGRYAASGRISYVLGLEGPSLTVDTACSSSLVAVHLACRSLWSGETSVALAGGSSVILQPHISIAYSQSAMLAPDARCKFGDARANGYVRSEGAGILVLKRLSEALRDGDRIHAVIRGSSVNNDGQTSGYLATPAQPGQEEMLRRAYADAGVEPSDVGYVEAHGTGTRAGDPVEVGAIGAVLGAGRPADRPCLVGSVKTNVGHTEGAAGVTGLIKAALALREGRIPASLHLQNPNPRIPWDDLRVRVPAEETAWPAGSARVAGVSSFGIAGTNAHVVLAAPPAPGEAAAAAPAAEPAVLEDLQRRVVALSARDPKALRALAARWRRTLAAATAAAAGPSALDDLARASTVRRRPLELRAAVVGSDAAELDARLAELAAGQAARGVVGPRRVAEAPRRVVFVFPGHGPQWVGMGRELQAASEPFRASLERTRDALAEWCDWDLLAELAAEGDRSRLDRIDVIQPALFALQVAYAAIWRAAGVEPIAVIGHSMGEAAAAHVAGALSLRDAARVIVARSAMLQRVAGEGEMAAVGLSHEEAEQAIAEAGQTATVGVAASNAARSTVISGDPASLDRVIDAVRAKDVFCRKVQADFASHSPQLDVLLDDLRSMLEGMEHGAPDVVFHSTVHGRPLEAGEFGPGYWANNLRQPVRFAGAVQAALDAGANTFVELSPHTTLLAPIGEALHPLGDEGLAVGSERRDAGAATLLESLAALHAAGHPVRWERMTGRPRRAVALPTYPWQRSRHWPDALLGTGAVAGAAGAGGAASAAGGHPLIDRRLDSVAGESGLAVLETELTRGRAASAAEADGAPILPAGAAVELLLAAAGADRAIALTDVRWTRPLTLPSGAGARLQIVSRAAADGVRSVGLHARAGETWEPHLAARIESSSGPGGGADSAAAAAGDDRPSRSFRPRSASAALRRAACLQQAIDALLAADGSASGAEAAMPFATEPRRPLRAERIEVAEAQAFAGEVRIEIESATADGGSARVRDASGRTLARVAGLRAVAADGEWGRAAWSARAAAAAWEEVWIPAPPTAAAPAPRDAEPVWALVGGPDALAEGCAEALAARGRRTVRLAEGDALPADPALAGALWLAPVAGVDVGDGGDGVVDDRPVAGLLERGGQLLAELEAREAHRPPRLWVVTRGACALGGDAPVDVAGGALWGWAAAAALELPRTWGGIVDLEPAEEGAAEGRSLVACLLGAGDEDRFAVRALEAQVPRVRRSAVLAGAGAPPRLDPQGAYLVTGGYGAAGRAAATWLAERGARRIVLVGRRGLPERDAWDGLADDDPRRPAVETVRALESRGVDVRLERLDVGDAAATADRVAAHAPLRGVVHAAGALETIPLVETDAAAASRLLDGKLTGARNLDAATRDQPLDFFVLYASISGVWGSVGLSAYAAANRGLDALAAERRRLGLPATAIDWGWLAAGGVVDADSAERFARTGLAPMPFGIVDAALDAALAADVARVTVAELDPQPFRAAMEARRARPLLAEMTRATDGAPGPAEAGGVDDGAGAELAARLEEALPGQRAEVLETFVREQVARILGYDEAEAIDAGQGFFKLGMDSMMTVQLRLRLESGIGRKLAPTVAFEYPTARKLAAYLDALLEEAGDVAAAAPGEAPAATPAATTPATAVGGEAEEDDDALTEDEIAARLMKKLEEMS